MARFLPLVGKSDLHCRSLVRCVLDCSVATVAISGNVPADLFGHLNDRAQRITRLGRRRNAFFHLFQDTSAAVTATLVSIAGRSPVILGDFFGYRSSGALGELANFVRDHGRSLRPCSPARAASIAALSASKFV